MTIRLVVRGLVASRGAERIAGPLDLDLAGGEALVVTGENGAGKSTLLRTLAGLLPAGGGTIGVEGAPARTGSRRAPAEVAHYLGHRNAMKAGLTVGANLDFWRRFLGGAAGRRRGEALGGGRPVRHGADAFRLSLGRPAAARRDRAASRRAASGLDPRRADRRARRGLAGRSSPSFSPGISRAAASSSRRRTSRSASRRGSFAWSAGAAQPPSVAEADLAAAEGWS